MAGVRVIGESVGLTPEPLMPVPHAEVWVDMESGAVVEPNEMHPHRSYTLRHSTTSRLTVAEAAALGLATNGTEPTQTPGPSAPLTPPAPPLRRKPQRPSEDRAGYPQEDR